MTDTSTSTAEPDTAAPAGLPDVRAVPLARLAQQPDSAAMSRIVPGVDAKRVATAAFQSSI